MLTELSREQVVEIGARNKAGNLLEQAGYTLLVIYNIEIA